MLVNLRNYTGRSGLANRINELIRQVNRLQPQPSPGILTSITSRGTIRRAIAETRAAKAGGEAVWL
jgi:hypothetical protein